MGVGEGKCLYERVGWVCGNVGGKGGWVYGRIGECVGGIWALGVCVLLKIGKKLARTIGEVAKI